jgi:type IV secretory pathway TraG/TraD family ATPase VirD4
VMTILQSAVQGEEVWGEKGLRKLWTAANLSLYGGGVSDESWLRGLSALIGVHDVSRWSQSSGRGGTSNSQTWSSEPILDIAELMALPRGRGVLLSSGNKAAMLRLVPWMDGPHADAVRASLSRWEPTHRRADRHAGEEEFREAAGEEVDLTKSQDSAPAPQGRNPLLAPAHAGPPADGSVA